MAQQCPMSYTPSDWHWLSLGCSWHCQAFYQGKGSLHHFLWWTWLTVCTLRTTSAYTTNTNLKFPCGHEVWQFNDLELIRSSQTPQLDLVLKLVLKYHGSTSVASTSSTTSLTLSLIMLFGEFLPPKQSYSSYKKTDTCGQMEISKSDA